MSLYPVNDVDITTIPDAHTIITPTNSAANNEPTELGLPNHKHERTHPHTSPTSSPIASSVTDTLQSTSVDRPADIASDFDVSFPPLISIPFNLICMSHV